ncbi:MAG: response regulator, partial [Bdellovibrionales bacterium]
MTYSKRLEDIQILAVDDEKLMLRLVFDVLAQQGFRHVTLATTGHQAIELVAERPFDLIITDLKMEGMDGLGVVRFVRQSLTSSCPRVPIIMLTATTEIKAVLEARDTGINEYLLKPFTAEQLMMRIRNIFEKP